MSILIAVIGGTGAQGSPVVKALLSPSKDGSPSPYRVRALTRNPNHRRAKELANLGAEIVQGSFLDFKVVADLFQGAYGAFVNTDGFSVGEQAETYAGLAIYEIAKSKKIRHFVWSSLDYSLKAADWDRTYKCDHYNAKGRVGEFLASQPNEIEKKDGLMWTVFTNGPYMDMLRAIFAPMKIREDGTRIFVSPIGETGTIPLIALSDLGWWVRHIFDSPETTTGRDLQVASHPITWPELVETFRRVTGLPAEYKPVTMEEYFALWDGADQPVANELQYGATSFQENFSAWFAQWRDNKIKRDMEWVRSVHPETMSVEQWMREENYRGESGYKMLKNNEDLKSKYKPSREKLSRL
ncbi:uncharacterized protein EI90DRAFT_2906225 [Cantharellus anzutake]|uniref:uncharacterized protein n=1 Tax=Cantharellus anzutake TaxID=1750568 RepID=UPI001908612C|nr:uncharacterized protein EI90DRAFT_2906225 [Cantharellus anzutake]KAF8340698.1 hypothetical protein EI90DRAFT_2906225 [Cantharellus anzutake]